MSAPLKILISAYACEPNRGSEPEVGWQLARHMARYHDITVVTRANNQAVIEKELPSVTGPRPQFIYYDLPAWVLKLKQRGLPVALYYFFWQLGVRRHLRSRMKSFDLIHHATFNSFRHPGFWWYCHRPVVLGPLGGGQICPWRFLPWFRKQVVWEIFRSLSVVNSYLFPHIYLSFFYADKILVANEDTARCVPWVFQPRTIRMLETGVTPQQVVESPPEKNWPGIRLLWISRLDKMKGGELALRAFAEALKTMPELTFTVVGGGPEERALKRLILQLGIEKAVNWQGRVPKEQITTFTRQHDIFVFTSLRDTSGNVALEAMAAGLPVITFRHHGVAEITTDETALRVPITSRQGTVRDLSAAMLTLARSPERCRQMGAAGRERVKSHYTWEAHARELDGIYRQTMTERQMNQARQQSKLRVIFSPKGIVAVLVALLLVGALEFFSVAKLKQSARTIVNDALPGLAYAGEANFNLAQSFNRTLLMILSEDVKQRATYQAEMDQFSRRTTTALKNYEQAVYQPEDRRLFDQLTEHRHAYLAVRSELLDLLSRNRLAEAEAQSRTNLLPAYERYKESGEALLRYNIDEGQRQGQSIMKISTTTQLLVALVGVVLFIAGFMIGFFR